MNKRLNVMILSPLALENGRGGEISAMELASGLHEFYNITLLDTNITIGKKLLSQESILKKLKGVKKSGCVKFATLKKFNKIFTLIYPWEILKLYKKIKENYIIYTSCFTIKTNLLIIFFSLLHRNAKFIIGHRKPLYSKKILSLYNLKYRISLLLFSRVKKRFHHHTISLHAKKYLENFFESRNITHIIHGIELNKYLEEGKEKKQEDVLNFIYVGYLDDIHKGVAVLLDAIEKVIGENENLKIFFEFCGKGPLESRLRMLQEKFPNFVKYNGYISTENISDYYKRNDIFLFTSRREPFGRVIIEALVSNLMIICTKTYGSIEILKEKKFAFFLNKLNTSEIENAIYTVYKLWNENKQEFNELREYARKYAIEKYDLIHELNGFIKLINSIIKNV